MKYYELDEEEKKFLKDVEADKYVESQDLEADKIKYQQAAQNTLSKNKNLNIRLSLKDLLGVKREAAEKGLPYQTLIGSIIHQYINQGFVQSSSNQLEMILHDRGEKQYDCKCKK